MLRFALATGWFLLWITLLYVMVGAAARRRRRARAAALRLLPRQRLPISPRRPPRRPYP
ncbi:hypothetical protein [Yinghuangia seranimata]|uniref:hypothetical protein n=1 Tax=Yinghuangia seranimata TaxID=408067 RepID=UPI00248B88B4|nr:hypothetical protein [Yinghuangia seranimata]MDI2129976.1 hypothetical protein [Yinghuangia seranimata]